MKEYIKQIYNEGFATTFYQKPVSFINKKIKNKTLRRIINALIAIFYTILILAFAGFVFYKKVK